MQIKVGFSRPKTWKPFAWVIMKLYGISYDHVYLRFHSDKYQRDLIYQASKMMVNFMGCDVFSKENVITDEFVIEVSDDKYLQLMQFAIDNAGKPYGVMEAIGLGIVRICRKIGIKTKNPFPGGSTNYVCSVLAGIVLEQFADAQIPGDPDDVSPLDLHDYLTSTKTA